MDAGLAGSVARLNTVQLVARGRDVPAAATLLVNEEQLTVMHRQR